jgi:hypothetical protein
VKTSARIDKEVQDFRRGKGSIGEAWYSHLKAVGPGQELRDLLPGLTLRG